MQAPETPEVLDKPLKELTSRENVEKKVTLMSLPHILPKDMPATLKKDYNLLDPFVRILSYQYMHSYLKHFFQTWGACNLKTMRSSFVETFWKNYVPYYALEYFSAEKLAKPGKEIIV